MASSLIFLARMDRSARRGGGDIERNGEGKKRQRERKKREGINKGLINGPGGGLERQAVGVVMGRQRPAIHSDCTTAPAISSAGCVEVCVCVGRREGGGISSDRNKPRHPSHPHGGRHSPRGGSQNDTRRWRRRHLGATKRFVSTVSATRWGDKGRGRCEKVP